jgi:hypothetical protein
MGGARFRAGGDEPGIIAGGPGAGACAGAAAAALPYGAPGKVEA